MANPRQRRKARSGSHRAVQHSKRAQKLQRKHKPIRGPKILQDAWDTRKTVRQNYAALGLVHSLNPTDSGGAEIPLELQTTPSDRVSASGSASDSSARSGTSSKGKEKEIAASGEGIPRGYGRIVRDENGNVVDVEMGEDEDEEEVNEEEDVLAEDKAWKESAKSGGKWTSIGGGNREDGNVIKALEDLSSASQTVGGRQQQRRHASTAEGNYLQRLVEKYGDEVEKMARDRRLNPEQRTAGELRRAIERAGL